MYRQQNNITTTFLAGDPAADPAAADQASVQLWSPATAAAHVEAAGMPGAAEQCTALAISGAVLLSMERADVFAQLKLRGAQASDPPALETILANIVWAIVNDSTSNDMILFSAL